MNFNSTATHDSKLPAFAGVSFTLHKLTEGRRLKMRLALSDSMAKIRALSLEKEAAGLADKDALEGKIPADKLPLFWRILGDMQEVMDDQVTPAWVRGLLVSVSGLTIDDKSLDGSDAADLLITGGPRDLYNEIALLVRAEAGLTERERGESAPPTTSSAAADGRMSDTSAPPADASDISTGATADTLLPLSIN